MNNEKSLYSSQNYVIKAISILSNMTNSILKASGSDNGGSLDHVSLVKSCLNTVTLLSHISAEFTRKKTSAQHEALPKEVCELLSNLNYCP